MVNSSEIGTAGFSFRLTETGYKRSTATCCLPFRDHSGRDIQPH
jgi:hypothetical protein